jgi:uncharacterized membrane protein YdbT with pleckstrin-like domain
MFGPDIELMPDEKMILASNPHWFFFWKQVAAAVGVFGLLMLVWTLNTDWLTEVIGWVALAAFIVLVINIIFEFIQWQTTRFAITDERVAYQSGMLKRRGVSIPLNRINNVNFDQSIIARLMNNGIVTIESAGQTGDSVFKNIPNPEAVRTAIFAQVEFDEQRDSDRDAASLAKAMREHVDPATAVPMPPSAPTIQERLAALEDLKEQGLIDHAEYASKRQQILDEL